MDPVSRTVRWVFETAQGNTAFRKFVQMRDHDGFREYMVPVMNMLDGYMLEHMLSDQFTRMTPAEKDVLQRVYALVHDIVHKVILQPEAQGAKLHLIRQHNKRMEESLAGVGKQRKEGRR